MKKACSLLILCALFAGYSCTLEEGREPAEQREQQKVLTRSEPWDYTGMYATLIRHVLSRINEPYLTDLVVNKLRVQPTEDNRIAHVNRGADGTIILFINPQRFTNLGAMGQLLSLTHELYHFFLLDKFPTNDMQQHHRGMIVSEQYHRWLYRLLEVEPIEEEVTMEEARLLSFAGTGLEDTYLSAAERQEFRRLCNRYGIPY